MSSRASAPHRVEYVKMYGRDFYNPTLGGLCTTIAWATTYSTTGELDESHPMWAQYFAYSEWFRHLICTHLGLPFSTDWMDIYRKAGVLVDEEYPTPEEAKAARDFGESQQIKDEMVPVMFAQFEHIKYQIVGRI